MLNRPRIRQLSLGELLDESFRLYRSNFLTLVAITALIIVPFSLLNLMIQMPLQTKVMAGQNQINNNPLNTLSLVDFFGDLVFWYLLLIVVGVLYTIVLQPLLEGALAHTTAQRYLSREIGVGSSFGMTLRHAPALIGARLIPVLIGLLFSGALLGGGVLLATVFVGRAIGDELDAGGIGALVGIGVLGFGVLMILVLVGSILMLRIMFTSQAIIVENAGAWQALVRSWRLTQGSFWRIVGYVLVIGLLIYLLVALPVGVLSFVGTLSGLDQQILVVINSSASAVLNVIALPFSMIAYTLLYFDLRVRNEGFDLEYQAATLLPDTLAMSALDNR